MRFGIGPKLYIGLLVGVLLTLSASLVAYFSFRQILYYEIRLSDYSIPNLSGAVDAARQSAVVVTGALRLISADSPQQHEAVTKAIARERAALSGLIQELESRSAFGVQTRLIEVHLGELSTYLELIQQSAARRLVIAETLGGLREELAETNRRIERHLATAIDDQAFYLVEGLRNLPDRPSPLAERASEGELAYYRNLVVVNHQANLAVLLLDEALGLSDRGLLLPLQERFHSAVQNFRRAYAALPVRAHDRLFGEDLERLTQMGESDEGGIIPLRLEALRRLEQEQEALTRGQAASELLLAEVNKLVAEINSEAVRASNSSRSAAQTGIVLLVLLNILSTVGAFLIGWLFVGRHLVRRLVGLATAMRSMAVGDLEVPVKVGGNDEVTDMAKALEVFRRYALEVQRLNLVEKLAEELDAKNHTLEQTLENLKQAQEQVVAEQKLASLGQLTAGVAHEIKNPLNFINNFSDVSVELIDEIEEIIEEGQPGQPGQDGQAGQAETVEEINAILSDLRLNLQKVKEHGQRADGIVRSMLEHSRSTPGEWRETDVNALLKQYMDLAYHAMRAHNSNFNVTMSEDLDPEMGPLEVVPQDIGRVFLNLVTNACQAIEEKRQQSDDDYDPQLRVSSRRLGDRAEFCVHDNGPGIPEEMRERIFEPFVTTKKTGEGTGLGLSLTTDILTRHGGSIRVDSQEDAFTEMTVVLPLEPPPEAVAARNEAEQADTLH
ncbi:MAG: HAMP domain-containing protein [Desulfurellaceae bacterium]|nr:HAMP domain-containing protein [Desulfurellaceae bacterium]